MRSPEVTMLELHKQLGTALQSGDTAAAQEIINQLQSLLVNQPATEDKLPEGSSEMAIANPEEIGTQEKFESIVTQLNQTVGLELILFGTADGARIANALESVAGKNGKIVTKNNCYDLSKFERRTGDRSEFTTDVTSKYVDEKYTIEAIKPNRDLFRRAGYKCLQIRIPDSKICRVIYDELLKDTKLDDENSVIFKLVKYYWDTAYDAEWKGDRWGGEKHECLAF